MLCVVLQNKQNMLKVHVQPETKADGAAAKLNVAILTHLYTVDSSTTTLWTSLFPTAGCLDS